MLALGSASALWSALLTVLMARRIITPPKKLDQSIRVLKVDDRAGTITLTVTPDTVLAGKYGFWFDGDTGHARLGEVLEQSGVHVVRRVLSVDCGELAKARRGRISGWFHLDPDELGYEYETLSLETELGAAPAWLIRAAGPARWVIQVHGRAAKRPEALRAVPVFREAGYNSLLISYRNDGEAPASTDHRYRLGDAEWVDVEAALQFAIDRGATEVVLMGWSMGAATVLQLIARSRLAPVVTGLVLESPVIDWVSALAFQGELMRIPRAIASTAVGLLGKPWAGRLTGLDQPIDLARLDFVRRAPELSLPILILHSEDDGFIPSTASQELARIRPEIVSLELFDTARHARLWNYDATRWNTAITGWLANLSVTNGS